MNNSYKTVKTNNKVSQVCGGGGRGQAVNKNEKSYQTRTRKSLRDGYFFYFFMLLLATAFSNQGIHRLLREILLFFYKVYKYHPATLKMKIDSFKV